VAFDVAPAASLARSSDSTPVRIAAGGRIVVAVALAAAGSFVPRLSGRGDAFFLLVELGWVPYATAVFFASARPGNRLAVLGGPLGDVVVLFGLQILIPWASPAALVGYFVVVTFGVFTLGRHAAATLAVGSIVLAVLAQPLIPVGNRLSPAELVPFSAGVLALLFILEGSATRQAATAALAERLQSKADTILANVADAVFVADATGHVVECNPAAAKLIGRRSEEVVGTACAAALGLHVGERVLDCSRGCALLDVVPEDQPDLGCEVWRVRPDERRQPLLANVSVIASADGHQAVHSLRDITRLKEAEEAKTLFLATASHELKTPLTVIQGFADTLVRFPDLDTDTKKAALEAIRVRSVELARIVDRLLMSSRIESGSVSLTLSRFDVSRLVEERTSAVAAATGRNVTYLGPTAGLEAVANEEALVTVVDHLVDNALKYSPAGGPVMVWGEADEDRVRIRVRDEGIGMDRDQAAACFDKFWQAESSDVRRFGGTGIGLYIVRSLVEGMGGAVSVHSTPGQGSTFTVELDHRTPPPRGNEPGQGEPTSIREFMRQIGVAQKAWS
jgi:PAS domain S-box-containing protein